ncbi:MAG: DNA-protecting protein DprA [Acidobacteria bacterium]|jgi:DNA processing protein|nr:MAG: DNA-protecting protein DprA [Acidobacteriota bacterium]
MERLYNWLYISAIKGLGEVSIKRLFSYYRSAQAILKAEEELRLLVGHERARAIREGRLLFDPEKVVKTVIKEGIGWTTIEDEDYPLLLKTIEDPPPVIFYRGKLKDLPLVGVVGTRNPDQYSINFTRKLVHSLVDAGFGVVSGGAKGIDYTSHLSCLQAGGYTVCLLGMGLLKMPSYLRKLSHDSVLFMSELLPEQEADSYTFPRRNRLISGLSTSLVVVEAGQRSGALITAEHGVRQGRQVYVHVGIGSSERWLGCIRLLNEGKAKFLRCAEDLLSITPSSRDREDKLLALLTVPKTFSELLGLTGLSEKELSVKLSMYEMEGRIERVGLYYRAL